jgi:hypothetical protein
MDNGGGEWNLVEPPAEVNGSHLALSSARRARPLLRAAELSPAKLSRRAACGTCPFERQRRKSAGTPRIALDPEMPLRIPAGGDSPAYSAAVTNTQRDTCLTRPITKTASSSLSRLLMTRRRLHPPVLQPSCQPSRGRAWRPFAPFVGVSRVWHPEDIF